MRITYYVHDLEFPLREGVRKQAWWLAQKMKKKGHDVQIVSTSKNKKRIVKDGIVIKYGSPFQISLVKTDVLHYISHPTPLIMPLLLFSQAKKQILTFFDGNLNGFWKRIWDPIVSHLVNKKVSCITYQTDYQKRMLKKTRLRIPAKKIAPLIPHFKKTLKKTKKPTLLFMSHFNESKGINEVLSAFSIVRKKRKDVTLVIANSGLTKNVAVLKRIKKMDQGDIIMEKIVDPQDSLSKAWVYLYPIKRAQETFSVPLSLIESLQVKTKAISTTVGGIPEYFSKQMLVSPNNHQELAQKILLFLKSKNSLSIKKFDNKKVVKKIIDLY